MAAIETYSIARMQYSCAPKIDLEALTADLRSALENGLACEVTTLRLSPTTAALDLPGLRLVLDYSAKGPTGPRLIVATGPSDNGRDPADINPRLRGRLAQTIVSRVASRYPAERTDWSDCPGMLTEAGLDSALDALTASAPEEDEVAPAPRPTHFGRPVGAPRAPAFTTRFPGVEVRNGPVIIRGNAQAMLALPAPEMFPEPDLLDEIEAAVEDCPVQAALNQADDAPRPAYHLRMISAGSSLSILGLGNRRKTDRQKP